MATYNPKEAAKKQNAYCSLHFAPMSGHCFRCGKNIYDLKNGPQAISVEEASSSLVTGCPFCHYSFVE